MSETQNYERRAFSYQVENDTAILSNNFGGLNVVATPTNLPYEDSPILLNCITDISGAVFKRKGTHVLNYNSGASCVGSVMVPVTTGLQFNLVVVKSGTGLNIYEVVNDTATQVMSKANVWTAAASGVRPSYILTSEVEPRIIFATGVNTPVQLKFTEQQQTFANTSQTSVTITNATRYTNASTSNLLVYVNRVRQTGWSVSYAGGSLTINNLPAFPASGTSTVVVDFISWQWWAEGTYWLGNSYYQDSVRANANIGFDVNVTVPSTINSNLDSPNVSNPSAVINVYKNNTRNSTFTYQSNNQPSTATQYSFSDGQYYVAGSTAFTNPSPFDVTFGALDGSTAYNVSFIRKRQTGFLFGNGQTVANTLVLVDGVAQAQSIQNGAGNDLIYKSYTVYNSSGTLITTTNTPYTYIGFEASTLGIPAQSRVQVIDTQPTYVGSNAQTTNNVYLDGGIITAYGFGQFADYNSGIFPRSVAFYQGRLVWGGFANNPMLLLFSIVYDSLGLGFNYAFYQVDSTQTAATSPFTVTLPLDANDRTVTCVEHQGYLFAMCRKSVYRLNGGPGQPITFSNRNANYLGNVGICNEQCIVKTDVSVMYLSDTGLYDLLPQIENQEYKPIERSVKIRTRFGVTLNPAYELLPWVRFSSTDRLVYVGAATLGELSTTRELYVYNTYRDSWTQYDTPSGFSCSHAGEYVDRGNGINFGAIGSWLRSSNVPSDTVFFKFNGPRYIDWHQAGIATGVGDTYQLPPVPSISYTTAAKQLTYPIAFSKTGKLSSFFVHPTTDVNDLVVTLNSARTGNQTVTLNFQQDYFKLPNGDLYLAADPGAGATLTISLSPPNPVTAPSAFGNGNDDYSFVFVDNVPVGGPSSQLTGSYSVSSTGLISSITTAPPAGTGGASSGANVALAANAVVEYGQRYLAIYTTPMFTQQQLPAFKRVLKAYAFMDNQFGQVLYQPSYVNSNDSQDPAQLLGLYTQRLDCNFTVIYSNDESGATTSDIYGFSDLVWDDASFDIQPSAQQFQPYQLFKAPIHQGVGYSYQLMIWDYDEATFRLVGYQIVAPLKGQRYIQPN